MASKYQITIQYSEVIDGAIEEFVDISFFAVSEYDKNSHC